MVARLFTSTIGKKAIVAATGAALVAFVVIHMIGHLQMFELLGGRDAYNTYAHRLQSLGGLKWAARGGLCATVILHIWASISLVARNRAARPEGYKVEKWVAASLGAQTMRATGPILLIFIVYHLLHFTVMAVTADGYQQMTALLPDGTKVADAYGRMVVAFQQPPLTLAYIVCMVLVGIHLAHGIQSTFQTLGIANATWRQLTRQLGVALAAAIVAGFCVVPAAILAGLIH